MPFALSFPNSLQRGRHLKVFLNSALLALAFLLIGNSLSLGSDMVTLTQADSGKAITVKVGDIIQIELAEQGSTGYLWQFDDLDRQFFELIDIATEKTYTEKNFTGGPVLKRWRLKAQKAGNTTIYLYYFRPWEDKSTAVRTFVLPVRIK
jgi:predicted secreted protein